MAKKSSGKKRSAAVGFGVGVTAALLSAAGAYMLYGSPNASQNRKKVKSWMLKAKAEVLEGIETAQSMSKEDYEKLVDKSLRSYGKVKSASASELAAFAKEMKAHWKDLEKKGKGGVKSVKRAVKKAK